MKWFLVLTFIFVSSRSLGLELTRDTSPRVLGSAKLKEDGFTSFACYKGSIMEARISVPGSSFDNVKIETIDDDTKLKVGEVKLTISAFSSKRIKRDLYAPYLDKNFKYDSRCQNDIFLGYEIAGSVRLSKIFFVAQEDVVQLKDILNKVRNLEDFLNLDVSAVKSLRGWGLGFSASDSRLDLAPLFNASSQQQYLNAANSILEALNNLYPVERVNRMDFDPTSAVYVRIGRP